MNKSPIGLTLPKKPIKQLFLSQLQYNGSVESSMAERADEKENRAKKKPALIQRLYCTARNYQRSNQVKRLSKKKKKKRTMVVAEFGITSDDLERQNVRCSMEKLKADASGIITCAHQLKVLVNHLCIAEGNNEKRSRELELKEKELQKLSSEIDKKSKTFEEEKCKAGDLKKLVEECTEELRSKRNLLTARLDSLTRTQGQLESKDKQLGQVMAELKRRCSEARNVHDRKREMEDETARKKKELSLIVYQMEESGKQLEKRSQELELKEKEIEEKRKELDLVKSQVKSFERKLIQLRESAGDHDCCTAELSSRKDQVVDNNSHVVEVELKKKQLGQMKSVLVKHSGVEEENHG